MPYKKEEILLCPKCKGSGKQERSELEDYHNNIYNYWDVNCPECKGHGRLLQITVVETIPLTEDNLKLRPKDKR